VEEILVGIPVFDASAFFLSTRSKACITFLRVRHGGIFVVERQQSSDAPRQHMPQTEGHVNRLWLLVDNLENALASAFCQKFPAYLPRAASW
jgi:hypothetical protein